MSAIQQLYAGGTYSSIPANISLPTVSGIIQIGQTITSSTGTWSGSPVPTYAYQWQRNNVNIAGATSSFYIITSTDYNTNLGCKVTATNIVGSVVATSLSTTTVPGFAPVNNSAPTVSGVTQVEYMLSCSVGSWTATPSISSYTYQWKRGGTTISGATGSNYVLVMADLGFTITCNVTATNAVGSTTAVSNTTATITILPQKAYTSPGTYSWTAPTGVTSVCVVCIGGGGSANYISIEDACGGGGGGLAYKNSISVVPGTQYSITVGSVGQTSSAFGVQGTGGSSSGSKFNPAPGGSYSGTTTGGNGGRGQWSGASGNAGGGGGAGGYAGTGGDGGYWATPTDHGVGFSQNVPGAGGSGGAAAGGDRYQGGGGVGILGQGASGSGSGQAGSGGTNGTASAPGSYGGGGGFVTSTSPMSGATGAVRIIWGSGRAYPSTRTADE